MGRVIHFEINADEPERAVRFYESVFGWTAEKWAGPNDYWVLNTGDESTPGINGGLMKRSHPGVTVVNTIDVESIESFTEKIEKAGGRIAVAKMAVAGVGYLAYAQDTEGNMFGIMQADESAQ